MRDPSLWSVPPGCAPAPPFNASTSLAYMRAVFRAHVRAFVPRKIFVFVRNSLPEVIRREDGVMALFTNSSLGWFHTSSEIEPRLSCNSPTLKFRNCSAPGGEHRCMVKPVACVGTDPYKYNTFIDFCKRSITRCYAEPWASAFGGHGGQTDARW